MHDAVDLVRLDYENVRATLLQTSYRRRWPRTGRAHELTALMVRAADLCKADPFFAPAWKLLSEIAEGSLDYEVAIEAINRYCTITGDRDKKVLKRLAALKEMSKWWKELGLSPRELDSLRSFLEASELPDGGSRFALVEAWASANGKNADTLISALVAHGGHNDMQVLSNVCK